MLKYKVFQRIPNPRNQSLDFNSKKHKILSIPRVLRLLKKFRKKKKKWQKKKREKKVKNITSAIKDKFCTSIIWFNFRKIKPVIFKL